MMKKGVGYGSIGGGLIDDVTLKRPVGDDAKARLAGRVWTGPSRLETPDP